MLAFVLERLFGLCAWHARIVKLESLKNALADGHGVASSGSTGVDGKGKKPSDGKASSTATSKKKGLAKEKEEEREEEEEEEEEEPMISTQELLQLEMPATSEDESSEGLLKQALVTSPVPTRKKTLKEMMPLKRPAAKEKPPMKVMESKIAMKAMKDMKAKKSIDKAKMNYKNEDLKLMVYKKTSAVAVRSKTMGQLFQVVAYKDVAKNKEAAEKLMAMLKRGSSLQKVLEAKGKLSWRKFLAGWRAKGLKEGRFGQ